MIEAIELIHVQGHVYSLLEFVPGLNIIKGESHEGKSSIARAFEKALRNKPARLNLLSWPSLLPNGKENMEIAIQFSKDEYIKMTKGKNKNQYEVSGYDDPFKALNKDVPEEVQLVTKMNRVNLQSQHEKFFMLQDSPGEVAKKFNKLLDLEIIDTTQSNINSKIKEIESTKKVHNKSLIELKSELSEYDFLDGIEILIDEVDKLSIEIKKAEVREAGIAHIIDEISLVRSRAKIFKEKAKAEKDIKEITVLVEDYKTIDSQLKSLITVSRDITQTENDIVRFNEILVHEDEINECKKLALEIREIDSKVIKIEKLCSSIEEAEKTRDMMNKKAKSLEKERDDLLKSQGICPWCGSQL